MTRIGLAVVSLAGLLGAAPAFAQSPPVHTPTGVEIVNIAACEFTAPLDPRVPTPPEMTRIESNRVVTPVAALLTLEPLRLEVEPAGTVAPGALLTYRISAVNRSGITVDGLVFGLPFDPGLEPPVAWTDGEAPSGNGSSVPVSGVWDPAAGEMRWTLAAWDPDVGITLEVRAPVRSDAATDTRILMTATATPSSGTGELRSNTVETAVVPPVLAITMRADRSAAIPGDIVVYELTVSHVAEEPPLRNVILVDRFPLGLEFLPGSARIDGLEVTPALDGDGGTLRIALGSLEPGETISIRLAAVVGPGASAGAAVNRAHAFGTTPGEARVESVVVSAATEVSAGPFRQEAFLLGRVFVDDDGDGEPDPGEPGVPGVLVHLEDGRGAVTDVSGRWSVEGVRPGLRVVRIDPSTLPDTLIPATGDASWSGSRSTRFLEVRASTLVAMHFPLGPAGAPRCALGAGERVLTLPSVVLERDDVLESAAVWLDGFVSATREEDLVVRCRGLEGDRATAIRKRLREHLASLSRGTASASEPTDAAASESGPRALEAALRSHPDATPEILAPADRSRAIRRRIDVDVIYPIGASPELTVGGNRVPDRAVGIRAELPSRGLAAARFVGVPLSPGANRLRFRAAGGPGPVEWYETVVYLPGPTVAIRLDAGEGSWIADGVTTGSVTITAVDGAGMRVAERPIVTVFAEGARPRTPDADPATEGLQVRLDDGLAIVRFDPVSSPGRVRLVAASGEADAEIDVAVVPPSGVWQVTGLAEGRVASEAGVEGDGGMPPGAIDSVTEDGGRIALFARGPIGEASRLTVSVDTERERDRHRLFDGRPEPDRSYPVAGDTSIPSGEAERQGPLYVRVDGPSGFAVYGDVETGLDDTELARYDRRLEGAAASARVGAVRVDAFAAETDQAVVRDVLEPDGSSGPFLLSRRPIVVRSERVFIEVRDRFRPDVVRLRTTLIGDRDYDLDPDTGAILFRSPVAPFDGSLDPVRIVVLYETPSADDRVVGGARASWTPRAGLEVGATAIREGRADEDLVLLGADVDWRPLPGTSVRGEIASSDEGAGSATAVRLEVASRTRAELGWEISYRDLPAGFSNPTLLDRPAVGGRRAGGSVVWEPSEHWRTRGEAHRQSDEGTGFTRNVIGIDAERRWQSIAALGGVRHVEAETSGSEATDATFLEAGIRSRFGGRWSAELLRRQALGGNTVAGYPTRTSAGIVRELSDDARLFLRHEVESGEDADRDRTVAGVETRLGSRAKALTQYALEDGAGGPAVRALTGVEASVPAGRDASFSVSAARVDTHRGDGRADYSTVAGAYERRRRGTLMTSRYEIRVGETETRHLATASAVLRLSVPWTLFVRERLFVTDPRGRGSSARAEGLLGLAFRPDSGPFRLLARLDHETGDAAAPGTRLRAAGDAVSLSVAGAAALGTRHRLAATWIGRRVAGDAARDLPSTFTDLISLHWTTEITPRWTIGGSVRRFAQRETSAVSRGAGIEVSHLVLRDVWVTGGWNVTGFADAGTAIGEHTERGGFVSVRMKFDEGTLRAPRDLRLDRD